MNNLVNALIVEINKARRSKMPLVTLFAFLAIPLAGTFFMIILKNPEKAKSLGIVSTKAQLLTAGTVSWKAYLTLISQAGIASAVIASFIAAWVFGREYLNKTLKDLLALPTSRDTIVLAKLILISVWSFAFSLVAPFVGIILGWMIRMPGWSYQLAVDSVTRYTVASLLGIPLAWAIAFIANIGKSYFPPLGFLVFMMVAAQISQILGWGEYFPWAVPGLYSNVANPTHLGATSYLIVIITGFLGLLGTIFWWRYADHTY